MFSHRGKSRKLQHNLQIASLLSFVAGIVNVAGFLSIQKLTTNVTGHFAFFVDEVFKLRFAQSLVYISYILFFLLGSFTSSFIGEIFYRRHKRFEFIAPVLLEIAVLLGIALCWPYLIHPYPDVIAFVLLFSMGLQNSMVTRISDARVRTTHLTGLFTDLGIELSQLFFYKAPAEHKKLSSNIMLRLTIITFFFAGGIAGGVCYNYIGLNVLFVPCLCLVAGLFYNRIRVSILLWKRRTNR